jgi:hypothetical protein
MVEGVINNKFNPNKQKQWTCGSIGFAIAKPKAKFEFIGTQENPTCLTTLPSIIHLPTMSM